MLTAAAVIFMALLTWWCWPFALIAVVSWTIWLRYRSPWLAAIVALLATAFLMADVAAVGYVAAWVAKALSYNVLFKKAAAFRAIAPQYYLTHPISVLRAWATNFKGLQYSFVRNVFLVLNALGGTLIFLVWQLYFADQAGSKKDTHGPARWAEKADLARVCEFGYGPGIVLGAMTDRKSVRIPPTLKVWMNKHVLVVGTPGSGKSRAYVRPNIMTAVREGISVLVTDPKGEIYRSMARWLRSKGYIVRKLDLVQMLESNKWNPLNEINEPLDADVFAEVVISTTDNGAQKSGDSFWNRAEQNLLKALVLYVCYEADGRRSPGHGRAGLRSGGSGRQAGAGQPVHRTAQNASGIRPLHDLQDGRREHVGQHRDRPRHPAPDLPARTSTADHGLHGNRPGPAGHNAPAPTS